MIPLTAQGTVFQEEERALIRRWGSGGPFGPPALQQPGQQLLGKVVLTLGRAFSWWSDGHLVGSSQSTASPASQLPR